MATRVPQWPRPKGQGLAGAHRALTAGRAGRGRTVLAAAGRGKGWWVVQSRHTPTTSDRCIRAPTHLVSVRRHQSPCWPHAWPPPLRPRLHWVGLVLGCYLQAPPLRPSAPVVQVHILSAAEHELRDLIATMFRPLDVPPGGCARRFRTSGSQPCMKQGREGPARLSPCGWTRGGLNRSMGGC